MSCWGIALSLYHEAADLHAQRVILDHSLGKSPLPLMIKSMTWQYKLYKKTTPNTESDDKGSILPILRAWHIPSGCKEISCSICCWMPWLTIWVFASESGLSRKSRLWGHWRQFLNRQAMWPPYGLLECSHHGLTTCDCHVQLPLTPLVLSHCYILRIQFESVLVYFQSATHSHLCDQDIYGFVIGSRPLGFQQCGEG